MDFIRSTCEKMNLWPVEHFFPRFFPDQCWLVENLFFTKKSITRFVNAVISTNQHWSGKKRGKKVFNSSEFHFFGSTSYEIHILGNALYNFQFCYSLLIFSQFFPPTGFTICLITEWIGKVFGFEWLWSGSIVAFRAFLCCDWRGSWHSPRCVSCPYF